MTWRRILIVSFFVVGAGAFLGWAGAAVQGYQDRSAQPRLPTQATADAIVIRKSERSMTLFRNGKVLKSYSVALGWGDPGPKEREGDNKTPEGSYSISGRNQHERKQMIASLVIKEPKIQ